MTFVKAKNDKFFSQLFQFLYGLVNPWGVLHLFVFFPRETAWVNHVLPFHRLLTFKGV